jgi:multidrug efflux pump subunit AcrB
VQRADRPYAAFYLGFVSSERSVSALTDYLLRTVQPQLSTIEGVQRVTNNEGGRNIAMRVWIDPDRLAALNLTPGDLQAALQRNNYLAAVGQTKSNLVQVNLLANTDLRSVEEFRNLIVAERNGAIVRLSDVARVELGAERLSWSPSTTRRNPSTSACGRSRARTSFKWRAVCARKWSGFARRCRRTSRCAWSGTARCSCVTL